MTKPLSAADERILDELSQQLDKLSQGAGFPDPVAVPESVNPNSFTKVVGVGEKPDSAMLNGFVELLKEQGYVLPEGKEPPADEMLPPLDFKVEPLGDEGKSDVPVRG